LFGAYRVPQCANKRIVIIRRLCTRSVLAFELFCYAKDGSLSRATEPWIWRTDTKEDDFQSLSKPMSPLQAV
jgi:hypothetical protein